MEIQFVIVRSENTEYLCHNVNGTYMDDRVFVSQCKWNVYGCQRPINRICFWRG